MRKVRTDDLPFGAKRNITARESCKAFEALFMREPPPGISPRHASGATPVRGLMRFATPLQLYKLLRPSQESELVRFCRRTVERSLVGICPTGAWRRAVAVIPAGMGAGSPGDALFFLARAVADHERKPPS
jgi:hypothetical protein